MKARPGLDSSADMHVAGSRSILLCPLSQHAARTRRGGRGLRSRRPAGRRGGGSACSVHRRASEFPSAPQPWRAGGCGHGNTIASPEPLAGAVQGGCRRPWRRSRAKVRSGRCPGHLLPFTKNPRRSRRGGRAEGSPHPVPPNTTQELPKAGPHGTDSEVFTETLRVLGGARRIAAVQRTVRGKQRHARREKGSAVLVTAACADHVSETAIVGVIIHAPRHYQTLGFPENRQRRGS